jgi:cation transport regulator ChaB
MPIPIPGDKEDRDTFINRCMGDDVMNREYKERDQRYAVCTSQWEKHSKSRNFEPPESGNLPAEGKKILSDTYNNCRANWVKEHPNDKENQANKESCSRIAWNAVKEAGYHKNKDGDWVKHLDYSNPENNEYIPKEA